MAMMRTITTAEQLLAAGAGAVWVVDPRARTVTVHAGGGARQVLREGEVLKGDPVVPGFEVAVATLFPAPE